MNKLNNIYKLFVFGFLSLFTITSCSDDWDLDKDFWNQTQDGIMELTFTVPDAEHIVTRADERDDTKDERRLNEIVILIFNEDGELLQRVDLDSSQNEELNTNTGEFSYSLALNDEVKSLSNPQVYAVANSKSITNTDLLSDFTENGNKKLEDLQSLPSRYYKNRAFLMAGKKEGVSKTIKLNRTAAKITLKDYTTGGDFKFIEDETNNNSVYDIYNTADNCFVIASLLDVTYTNSSTGEATILESSTRIENNGYRYDSYASPTKTHDGADVWTYVVFHGSYKGKGGYYAVDLRDETGKVLDILPNYWYEMKLEEVSVEGYETADEALKNPFTSSESGGVVYTIHEHAPEIMSMISDGVHELGVTPEVTLTVLDGASAKDAKGEFIVKCYSADGEEFNRSDLIIEYDKDDGWFDLDNGVEYTAQDKTTGNDVENTKGKQYKFTLTVNRELYSDRDATIIVRWKGLERTVSVNFDSTRPLSDLCGATLTIKDGSNGVFATIDQYWDFILGTGKSNDKEYSKIYDTEVDGKKTPDIKLPRLWGINKDQIAGDKERTRGLHFPMPYGDNSQWTYEYELDFGSELDPSVTDYNLSYIPLKDAFFSKYLDIDLETKKENKIAIIKIKEDKLSSYSSDYEYAVSSIQFQVTIKGINYYLNFDLYHTGFFHYEDNEDYGYTGEDQAYYYYEVIEMEGMHWLDRNLGAKSNNSYVRYEDGTSIGDKRAIGKFFTIAEVTELDELATYKSPKIKDDMCPPGYRIPSTSDWNMLRLSADFRTEKRLLNENSYMSTFYDTHDLEIGDVFFQKGGYYNDANSYETLFENEANTGDGASGYFWTTTEAPGMEKEHIGNWLRTLYINGSATNFNNGSIRDHKVPVRCVADNEGVSESEVLNHYISFNVHGVTHVILFIYSAQDDQNLSSTLYTFPGKAVGSAESAKKWQNFAAITSANMDNMYAIFTRLNKDGTATVFAKTEDKMFEEVEFNSNLFVPERSWKVKRGAYYDFCEAAATHPNPDETRLQFDESTEDRSEPNLMAKNVWGSRPDHCKEGDDNQGGGDVTPSDYFKKGDQITFIWAKTLEGTSYPRFVAYYYDTDNRDLNGGGGVSWNGNVVDKIEDGDYYKYTISNIPADITSFKLRVCKDENDWNGVEFEVKYNSGANKYEINKIAGAGNPTGGYVNNPDRSKDEINWTIRLFEYDGIEGEKQNKYDPSKKEEQIIWQGSKYENWTGFDVNWIDWSDVETGTIMKVYFNKESDGYQMSLRSGDNYGWTEFPNNWSAELKDSDGDNIEVIEFTEEALSIIVNTGYLKITGTAFTLTKITLTPPDTGN